MDDEWNTETHSEHEFTDNSETENDTESPEDQTTQKQKRYHNKQTKYLTIRQLNQIRKLTTSQIKPRAGRRKKRPILEEPNEDTRLIPSPTFNRKRKHTEHIAELDPDPIIYRRIRTKNWRQDSP